MRLKDLFTVPAGQKVTERHLRRVLVSSICSILLCMSCLVGTTWAWFTVSLENTDNEIRIGPEVTVSVNGEAFASGSTLTAGKYTVSLTQNYVPDDFHSASSACVALTLDGLDPVYYVALSGTVTIEAQRECTLTWQVLWAVPEDAAVLTDGAVIVPSMPQEDTTPAGDAGSDEEPSAGMENTMDSDEETAEDSETPDGGNGTPDGGEISSGDDVSTELEDTTGETGDGTGETDGEPSGTEEIPAA